MPNYISEELRNKIVEYVDCNIIEQNDVFQLFKIRNEDDLIDTLSKLIKVSNEEKKTILLHIINDYWKNVDDIFNKNTIMFLKTIINFNGVITRQELQNNVSSFKNIYSINTAVIELIEMGIIDKIKLNNSKILFVISSKIMTNIRGENNVK